MGGTGELCGERLCMYVCVCACVCMSVCACVCLGCFCVVLLEKWMPWNGLIRQVSVHDAFNFVWIFVLKTIIYMTPSIVNRSCISFLLSCC